MLTKSSKATSATLGSINIIFLGTASAQPSSTRNHSSLALRLGGDVWIFDCGEATQHQIQKSGVKLGKIKKIFITHTHGDHIFGLLPLMASCMNGAGGTINGVEDERISGTVDREPLEIYGPLGTRAYVRNGLTYTHTILGSPYVVHELRFPTDPPTEDYTQLAAYNSEIAGRNIAQVDGVWPGIYEDSLVSVTAAPILHSVPSVGYVVTEKPVPGKMDPKEYVPHIKRTNTPMSVMSRLQSGEIITLSDGTVLHGPSRRQGRKITILGDTYDPSPIASLSKNSDVLIHEATNAHLPGVDSDTKPDDSYETVELRTKSRGHSTPQMAGSFATCTSARRLLLNHFSARYPGNDDVDESARRVMDAIRALAAENFSGDIICARDFMSLDVQVSGSVL